MGKRKRGDDKRDLTAAPSNLGSPFAALAGLRETLPAAPGGPPAEGEVAPDAAETELSGCGKIVVRREKKGRAGKTVTRIEGLPPGALPALAKRMKGAFGCGATIEGTSLVLLGSLVDRAVAWLVERGAKHVVSSS